jgi:eukaryotic-like serine/threonine-protein kinase
MSLGAGTRLGPYEIQSPLGAGGMGEVYKARDTRLERTVAIKVLPDHLSSSPEVRQRFEREAKTISQLSHPHICALYDVGREGETEYLVMEYLEGETLAERLIKGGLPLDQALRYGIEIADALDRAHRQGIVHRDLKPGNVMLTRSGVKLLDFGLAKAMEPATARESLTSLPTQKGLTQEGTILGTFQYMAPEQLEGKEADARTDIFALGVVLYEMATGQKAFTGATQASLISRIMTSDPAPISTVQPMAPPALDRVVRTCLAKDPEDRWQSAHDVGSELKWIAEGGSQAGVPTPVASRRRFRERLRWILAGAFAGALIAGLTVWASIRAIRPERSTGARLAMPVPATEPLALRVTHVFAFSPDGTRIVYLGRKGKSRQLYLRPIDQFNAVPIPGTEGAEEPVFSPDGQWVAFDADDKLKKVSLSGGLPVSLCAITGPQIGAAWGTDDTIVFSAFSSGLFKISADGGTPTNVATPDPVRGERAYIWPRFLPDGKSILFTIWTGGNFDDARIAVLDLATGKKRSVLEGGTDARYLPTGHLLYERGGSLLAVRFDAKRFEVIGPPITVLGGVLSGVINGESHFDVSAGGSLAYLPGGVRAIEMTLVWVDRRGTAISAAEAQRAFAEPAVSPDGRRLAVTVQGSTFDVWVYDFERSILTRLSFGGDDSVPVWTRDGRRVAWSSSRGGRPNIFWRSADASGVEERLTTSDHPQFPQSFSPDGKLLLFLDVDPSTGLDEWILPVEGDRKPRPFLRTPFRERQASFSRDGGWVVYVSDESGREEVYVAPYPGPGGKVQVSPNGGTEPTWSPTGRELFYRNGDKLVSVAIQTTPSLSVGRPVVLFEAKYEEGYDVAPDGQRFLMIRRNEEQSVPQQINVVLGWLDELKRRVPAGKRR